MIAYMTLVQGGPWVPKPIRPSTPKAHEARSLNSAHGYRATTACTGRSSTPRRPPFNAANTGEEQPRATGKR